MRRPKHLENKELKQLGCRSLRRASAPQLRSRTQLLGTFGCYRAPLPLATPNALERMHAAPGKEVAHV